MPAILGISAFYHDSAAALVVDGRIVAAAQEERFTRRKHDSALPAKAIDYCLQEAGLGYEDLDYVAFYEKPLTKFERLLETYLAVAPAGLRSFSAAMPAWLNEKLRLRSVLRQAIHGARRARLVFLDHHESHAASAFFPSPFPSAAILTIDGVGEWTTTAFGRGIDNRIELTGQVEFPHSLGLLYAAFTQYCGFKINGGEHKLMGLAPFGQPIYREAIFEHLLDLKPDGSFRLNMDYFNYCQGLTMTNRVFARLFGGPPRKPDATIEKRHMDLAASIQTVTEEAVLRIARHVHREIKDDNLVLAGGVALNCVANGRLLREGPFHGLWIQPTAGDAGGALGAALFVWHQLLGRPRAPDFRDSQQGSLLGPRYSNAAMEQLLAETKTDGRSFASEAELLGQVAALLAAGNIVGWFHGRMEFGPRALGARSILADPRSPVMQSRLNLKTKFRESFRPFAPSVLQEQAAEWFDLRPGEESPYMLVTASVRDRHRLPIAPDDQAIMRDDPDLRRRINVVRSTIPAVTHVDYSARIQTVDEHRHGRFCRLLKAFHAQTGCPLLLNTSFNVRGEPIVCTPREALDCFNATDLDALVLEDYLVVREKGSQASESARQAYLAQFETD